MGHRAVNCQVMVFAQAKVGGYGWYGGEFLDRQARAVHEIARGSVQVVVGDVCPERMFTRLERLLWVSLIFGRQG